MTQFRNVYSELKAQAEATVLLANDTDSLLTCALRPANIFGPGDKQLLPCLVDVAKSSWAKVWKPYWYSTLLCTFAPLLLCICQSNLKIVMQ